MPDPKPINPAAPFALPGMDPADAVSSPSGTGLVTIQEAAERLGLEESTLRRRALRGDLPQARKVGQIWVIPMAELYSIEVRTRGRPRKPKPPLP